MKFRKSSLRVSLLSLTMVVVMLPLVVLGGCKKKEASPEPQPQAQAQPQAAPPANVSKSDVASYVHAEANKLRTRRWEYDIVSTSNMDSAKSKELLADMDLLGWDFVTAVGSDFVFRRPSHAPVAAGGQNAPASAQAPAGDSLNAAVSYIQSRGATPEVKK